MLFLSDSQTFCLNLNPSVRSGALPVRLTDVLSESEPISAEHDQVLFLSDSQDVVKISLQMSEKTLLLWIRICFLRAAKGLVLLGYILFNLFTCAILTQSGQHRPNKNTFMYLL